MLITEFLPFSQFNKYGDWLKSQDAETKQSYFGIATSDYVIDKLIDRIGDLPDDHYILVAHEHDQWVGSLHIATRDQQVEFGLIVATEHRGRGIANLMLEQGLVWARNRGYRALFMHCLGWNKPIQHLCHKHGLTARNMHGDSEVQVDLAPPSWATLTQEVRIQQRNIFHNFLQSIVWLRR
jgi:RimJ/RimL family protein N-acetyltransferase